MAWHDLGEVAAETDVRVGNLHLLPLGVDVVDEGVRRVSEADGEAEALTRDGYLRSEAHGRREEVVAGL
eukprot:4665715-Alexandrium_andersonii.AAC.1